MSKPSHLVISGPSQSKSGRTESQYSATLVAPDGNVRFLTWSSSISPQELGQALIDAGNELEARRSGVAIGTSAVPSGHGVDVGKDAVTAEGMGEEQAAGKGGRR